MVALTTNLSLEPNDSRRLATLCGPCDQNLRQLESRLGIHIRNRGNSFELSGSPNSVKTGQAVLSELYDETESTDVLHAGDVQLSLQDAGLDDVLHGRDTPGDLRIRTRKKSIKPRGIHQAEFVRNIRSNDVSLGIGPAGTGKTYLAVACAIEALENNQVNRVLLVRPAVEVGERLGFLPGDVAQKIDPYLRPLYDALYEMLGPERVHRYIERNTIEIAPLAYMRGRTLNSSFIILDESQNTTVAQMKMFLTRLGFGAKVAITGDITQIDLPQNASGDKSGLIHVLGILGKIKGLSITRFDARDVVRHPLVQRIVEAYARDAERHSQELQSSDFSRRRRAEPRKRDG